MELRLAYTIVRFYTAAPGGLARLGVEREDSFMRYLLGFVVVAAILIGLYEYNLRKLPVTDEGTAPTQAISLTGVRGDLLKIAQAERMYIATNGRCASFDELMSTDSVAMAEPGRDGYSYSVECSGTDFTISAKHAPAPEGSSFRYPTLVTDQTMEVHEVN